MRKLFPVMRLFIITTAILIAVVFVIGKNISGCPAYRYDGDLFINNTKYSYESAATQESQEIGLSRRTCIPENAAMLFEFENESTHPIWMKEMLFTIDVVWLNEDKKVVYLTENFTPESYPEIRQSNTPSRYVIELSSGTVKKHNISIGTQFYW